MLQILELSHPFLQDDFYIQWNRLTADHVEVDIEKAIQQAQNNIDSIANQPLEQLTFDNTFLAFDRATEILSCAWHKVNHLDSVCNDPALRKAMNAMLPRVTAFYSQIYLHSKLWSVLSTFSNTQEASDLTGIEKRFLEEVLADFRENGADLSEKDKHVLQEVDQKLAQLTQVYSENVLDATNAWEWTTDNLSPLSGLPESALRQASQSASSKGKNDQWRFTLHQPSYLPVMQYLDNSEIRHQFWAASNAVGRETPHDNTLLIQEILDLRQKKAELLGKANFVDLVLERRMAKSGDKALDFVTDLHDRIESFWRKEWNALELFKAIATQSEVEALEPWDVLYWAEKRRKAEYDFDEEVLRPYFPINTVLQGLFSIAEKLYSIKIEKNDEAQKWHPDVEVFDVFNLSGKHIGSFYTDWYPRESKRSGAWMGYLITGNTGSPHMGLICGNLTPPHGDTPALLNHDEVQTIFHEFGHLLHHLLSTVPIHSLHGTQVAWDFVELPSQMMENWCWDRESLNLFARHYETGEPIPQDLYQKMVEARNYLAATTAMRQLAFAKMDLELHTHYMSFQDGQKEKGGRLPKAMDGEEAKACILQQLNAFLDEFLRGYIPATKTQSPYMTHRFGHLFSSPTGYAAGYYSYKWAEVLDADAFTRFQKEGILNPETGRAFQEAILSQGNSQPPEVLFRNFMGRDPQLDPLLKRSGLSN